MEYLERLQTYATQSIGLQRGEVQLAPHNPRWKRLFSDEAHLIYDQMRIEGLRIYHCGSTSIPGISAKPILDIVASTPSLDEFDNKISCLQKIGYEPKGEYGIPGRRYSVLYDTQKTTAFVHFHVFSHGSPEVAHHLRFRDFLRSNPVIAKEYEAEKIRLVQSGTPRASYTDAKAGTIQKVLSAANATPSHALKYLCLLGSAPGGKNTTSFLREGLSGAAIEVLSLADLEISPYRYADDYKSSDRFSHIVEQMIAADIVVFATPVYWYAMSGAMKNFFDRFSNLLRGQHKPLGEALYGKKVRLLATGSDERLPLGFEVPFSSTAIYLGMDYMGADYRAMLS